MAAGPQGYPKWLLNCKQNIGDSKDWNVFLRELHDAVQQQLTESHVQYFSDLSEPEKELFMQRATKALEGGTSYNNLMKKVSLFMDQSLNEEVSRQLLEDSPIDTKSDLIIENAEEGTLSLLKKWPEMKEKLHVCLNQPLPPPLRQLAWRLHLSNTKVRKQYVDLLNTNPRAAISQYDYEISQKCEQLIKSETTLSDLRGSVGNFYGMKAVLSYHHSAQKTKNRLRDVDHLLVVPFIQVASSSIPRKEPPAGRVVALLVEEFETLMDGRPGFVEDSGSDIHNEEVRAFIDKVATMLSAKYPESVKNIVEKFSPSKEKIVATETGNQTLLREGLMAICRPMLRSLFVTYLNPDTLLYVWDNYIIGLDTPGFSTEWLAIVLVTILGLTKDKIKGATSPVMLEKILKDESCKLTVPQIQYEVKQYYYKDLYSMLTRDSKAAIPVLDPTQALHPPWRHWYNDVIPPFTKPQDRRKAREEREAERERMAQQQKDAETARRDQEARDRRDEEEEYLKLSALDRQRVEQERIKLEEQIQEERRRRVEAERRAADEIEKLRLEIAGLKNQKPPTPAYSPAPSISSYISRQLLAPPPSRISTQAPPPVVVVKDVRTPTPVQTPVDQKNKIVADFLTRVLFGLNKVAHAEDQYVEKEELDRATQGYLLQNVKDIKQAQKQLFGHHLKPGEFDKLPAKQQQEKSESMIKLMQTWREERREKELAQNRDAF
ncbi:uncharacterized protein LOC125663636 isoform X2 [Ostrea edulis]|uniref:uncharacterized protein LOC125663636 isoform X2 n=1 Tax=Ostrea edulis TaxID=37623 RepID=UPI0020959D04|nr:uncharacterized protein LOC125663636 isoform X2 [Ostrea edulis]